MNALPATRRPIDWPGYLVAMIAAVTCFVPMVTVSMFIDDGWSDPDAWIGPLERLLFLVGFAFMALAWLALPIIVVGLGLALLIEEVLLRRVGQPGIHLAAFVIVGFVMAAPVLALGGEGHSADPSTGVNTLALVPLQALLAGSVPAVTGYLVLRSGRHRGPIVPSPIPLSRGGVTP